MRGRALIVAALMLTVPATALGQGSSSQDGIGDTDEITFYGHVFGHGLVDQGPFSGPMPANTQPPIGESNYGIGTGGNCVEGDPTAGTPAALTSGDCEDATFNKLALFSTAGPVQVDTRAEFDQNGRYAQLHNERGQTKDVLLDTGESVTASVFTSLDMHGWFVGAANPHGTNCMGPHPENVPCMYPYWGWDPGVFEDVVVGATLYHANLGERSNASAAPPIAQAIQNGSAEVLANGQWGPGQVINGLPGSPNVNKFDIDLGAPQKAEIPNSDDFFLVYSVYQETNGQNYFLNGPARWWSGEFFPPTFQLPVENAFAVEQVVPSFSNAKVAILGIINTPWGSYDVDDDSVDISIEGPNGQSVPSDDLTRFADFSVAHGGHFKPVNLTWVWDYRGQGATPGNYSVTISASNSQHSASASCTAWFTVEATDAGRPIAGDTGPGTCGTQSLGDQGTEEYVANPNEES